MTTWLRRLAVLVLGLVLATGAWPSLAVSTGGTARSCTHPSFVLRGDDGGRTVGRYYLDPDLWNVSGYHYRQTTRVCGAANWSATVTTDNRAHDGAVKAYPNVHRDFIDWGTRRMPALSSFASITTRFASRQPDGGIYDTAYDLWLNGVADDHSVEVMIWTHNHRQVPAGDVVERGLSFSGRTWTLYATDDGSYLALVPRAPLDHGAIDLKALLQRLVALGRLPHHSRLGQICFGFETVSTGGRPERFKVDRFSVRAAKK